MKCIVNYGFEPYIDEIVECPQHQHAVEIPEDLVRLFRETQGRLVGYEQEIRALLKDAVQERASA